MTLNVSIQHEVNSLASLSSGEMIVAVAKLTSILSVIHSADDALTCLQNALESEYSGKVSAKENVIYKYVFDPIEGEFRRICCELKVITINLGVDNKLIVNAELGTEVLESSSSSVRTVEDAIREPLLQ